MEKQLTTSEIARRAEELYVPTKERLRGRPKKPGGAKERVVLYVEPTTARALEALAGTRGTTVQALLGALLKVATKT